MRFETNMQPTPSVFNEGFSWYETVSKLLYVVNELIDSANGNNDDIALLTTYKNNIEQYLSATGDFSGTWNGLTLHETTEGQYADFTQAIGTHYATLKEKLDDIAIGVNVKDFGAKCDGTTDDSLALENALAYAVTNKRQKVYVMGRLRITRNINVPKNVKICGVDDMSSISWIPELHTTGDVGAGRPHASMGGSWIFCDMGVNEHAFTIANNCSGLENLGFWYPQNALNYWTSLGTNPYTGYPMHKPQEFLSTVYVTSGQQCTLENLFFINSYHAIELYNCEHFKLKKIKISPLKYGVTSRECGATGEMLEILVYPFWSKPYESNYLDMMRPIIFSGYHGYGVYVGNDTGRTIEQVIMDDINVFCCGDGIVLDGKGVQLSNFKVDNTLRCLTVNNNNASMLHNISNGWLASYTSYGNTTPISDGNVYGMKISSGGCCNVSNVNIATAQGYGVWITNASYKTSLSNIYIGSCYFRGYYIGGDDLSYRISLNNCLVNMSNEYGVAFTFKNLVESFVDNIVGIGVGAKYHFMNAYNTLNDLRFLEKEDITFYVDGSQVNDGYGTDSSPFKSLASARSMIPKNLKGKVTIVIVSATGQTDTFENYNGGEIVIMGRDGGANQSGKIALKNIKSKLSVKDLSILVSNATHPKALEIDKCPNVYIDNVFCSGDNQGSGNGMFFTDSKVKINNSMVQGFYYGLFADEFSGVKSTAWKVNTNVAVGVAVSGASSFVKADTTLITGGTPYVEVSGGKLYS